MVEIKNTRVYGLEGAIKRSGYPTRMGEPEDLGMYKTIDRGFGASEAEWVETANNNTGDYKRGRKLGKVPTGSGHDNYLKGIIAQFDLKYPLYFTKQLQRYHFIDFISSQSTMHSITKQGSIDSFVNKYVNWTIIDIVNNYIYCYNEAKKTGSKEVWNCVDDKVETVYEIFMRIISNLPSGFELWAGMTTNYLQLKTMYQQRRNHKLKEDWGAFCDWIESLPRFKELILEED